MILSKAAYFWCKHQFFIVYHFNYMTNEQEKTLNRDYWT